MQHLSCGQILTDVQIITSVVTHLHLSYFSTFDLILDTGICRGEIKIRIFKTESELAWREKQHGVEYC